jgi:hypothetical protein
MAVGTVGLYEYRTKPLVSLPPGEVFMARFNLAMITALSCATGIMALSATAAQADEVRWNCGNRWFGPSTNVSLNSGGGVQWSTSDWQTWARAAESGCRLETTSSPRPQIYVNTTPSRVYVEPAAVSLPASSPSITVNINPDPYPAALW